MSQGLSGLPSLVPSTTKVLYLPPAPGHREIRWPQSNNSQYQPYFIHSIVTVPRLLQLQWSSSSPPQPACSIHSSHNLWLFHLHMYTSETTGRMEGNRRPSLPTDLIETPPFFSGCVSQIFLWRNPIMSLNRLSNSQYTWTIPSFNLKQNFSTVQRVTVTSNSHQPFVQQVGIWWEVQKRVKLKSKTLPAPFLAQSLTCFAWWAQTYHYFSLWTQSRKLNTHQIRITTII